MRKVSDEEVEFILRDLEAQGIVYEDLRYDLLDHLCCIIENEMKNSDDFHRFYQSILPRFFKSELKEIQQETDKLLTFKNFYSMLKTLRITGGMTVLFTVLGAVFKTLHWPGAGVMIVSGAFMFSFIFMPLLIILKFRDDERKVDKLVFTFGLIMGLFVFVGLVLKLMHWPGATVAMLTGTVVFTFVYVPIYFITRVKRPELRFNTTVNSVLMMACGGLLYALFDLGYTKSYNDIIEHNNKVVHENSEVLFTMNNKLISLDSSEQVLKLHELTNQIDDDLEGIVKILDEKHSLPAAQTTIKKMKEKALVYNKLIQSFDLKNTSVIEVKRLDDFSKMKLELMITELALIQQQIAVNENNVLSNSLLANR